MEGMFESLNGNDQNETPHAAIVCKVKEEWVDGKGLSCYYYPLRHK